MSRRHKRRKPMSEINVVPYIDVMLVLLIIFMVTAPMLMQGVKVDLPKAAALPVGKQDNEPLIVSVKADGSFFINLGKEQEKSQSLGVIQDKVSKIRRCSNADDGPAISWCPFGGLSDRGPLRRHAEVADSAAVTHPVNARGNRGCFFD